MKGRSVGVIVLIIITLALGVGAIIIGDQLTRQNVDPDDTSAFDAQSRVFGQTCDIDADCKPSTVGFPVGCRTVNGVKKCVNTNCPNTTVWGTRGDCYNATNTCGEPCGGGNFGLCNTGFSCTYVNKAQCALEGTVNQNQAEAYCVPPGTMAGGKGPITQSWYTDSTEKFARAACSSTNQSNLYTASGNNFVYHPSQGTNYNRRWTQEEIINYICNPPVTGDPGCGNGIVDTGEACDNGDANSNTGAVCSATCQLNPECNDGQDNDGDAIVDCNGAGDPGCFPNGNGGGGSCSTSDDSEENAGVVSCSEANSDVIDFETVGGQPTVMNTAITNQFASQGVTFSVADNPAVTGTCSARMQIGDYLGEGDAWGYPNGTNGQPDAVDTTAHPTSETGTYFLAFAKSTGAPFIGAADIALLTDCILTITYTNPTTEASGYTIDNETVANANGGLETLDINAYNAAGQVVDTDTVGGATGRGGDGRMARFEVSSPASNPISRITITYNQSSGNFGFDNFSAYCLAAPLCGNGDVESGEECDDGDDNANTGALCNTQCELNPECSDGQDNDGDGATDCEAGAEDPGCFPNGRGGGGSCNPDDDSEVNTPAVCGDGVVDTGEICGEPGLSCSGGDTCQSCSCVTIGSGPVCGDGTREGAEACDDGNQTAGDGCSAACTVTTQCNDGVDNDGDGRIDCQSGNADLGCFPNGNGGGGACNPLDNSELNAAPTIIPNTALVSDEADRVIIGLILVAVAGVMIRFNVLINGYELLGKIQRVYLSKDEVKRTNINKD